MDIYAEQMRMDATPFRIKSKSPFCIPPGLNSFWIMSICPQPDHSLSNIEEHISESCVKLQEIGFYLLTYHY